MTQTERKSFCFFSPFDAAAGETSESLLTRSLVVAIVRLSWTNDVHQVFRYCETTADHEMPHAQPHEKHFLVWFGL
jgi:hypothetical protein